MPDNDREREEEERAERILEEERREYEEQLSREANGG